MVYCAEIYSPSTGFTRHLRGFPEFRPLLWEPDGVIQGTINPTEVPHHHKECRDMLRDRAITDQQVAEQRTVARAPWSPAQLVALVIGLAFVVLGGVALARTGLHFSPIRYADVAGFGHTALLAIIEIVFGVVVLAAGAMPGADRGGMI